jgi:hypothetical protein
LVIAYRYWIGAWLSVTLLSSIILLAVFGLPTWLLSTEAAVLLLVGVFAAVFGFPAGLTYYRWFAPDTEPDWRYIVVMDCFRNPGITRVDRETMQQMDVRPDGASLHQWGDSPIYEARDYDATANRAYASWRGHVEGSDLVSHQNKVDQILRDYEVKEAKSRALRLTFGTILRSTIDDIVTEMIETYEKKAIYQGELIEEKIQAATEEFATDDEVSHLPSTDSRADLDAVAESIGEGVEEQARDAAEAVAPSGEGVATDGGETSD